MSTLRKNKVHARTTHNLDNCVMGHIDSTDTKNKIVYRLLHAPRGFIVSIIDGENTTDYNADTEFNEFIADLISTINNKVNEKK